MKLGAGVLVATMVLMGGQAMQAYAYCGFPRALDAHIGIARRNGVDAADIREILALVDNEKTVSAFALGELNPYAKYFSGRSWLEPVSDADYAAATKRD